MAVPVQEVDSSITPAELASLLEQKLLVRFRDSGCVAGYSVSRQKIMGIAPNDHLDYVGGQGTLSNDAHQILYWAREWAEFKLDQTSRR
jgi:hypothetical protein